MDLSGGEPRYRGIRQMEAARGILTSAYLSAMLWVVLGFGVEAIL